MLILQIVSCRCDCSKIYATPSVLVKTPGAVSVLILWTRFHDKRESCRSSFCVLSMDNISWRKRIFALRFMCSFCGQDSMTKENLVAPVSVFFLWTIFHDERESCRSSLCVLSVDNISWRKRILSLQFMCSFYGQNFMTKENLVASVSVFFLWTIFHDERESCSSSLCVLSVDKTPWRKRIVSLQFSSKTWDPPTQLYLSLYLPRYPLGCCIDDGVGNFLLKMLPLLSSSKNTTWFNMFHISLIFSNKTLRIKTAAHNRWFISTTGKANSIFVSIASSASHSNWWSVIVKFQYLLLLHICSWIFGQMYVKLHNLHHREHYKGRLFLSQQMVDSHMKRKSKSCL